MLRKSALLIVFMLSASVARADIITGWNCENDGDGAINCEVVSWVDKDADDIYEMVVAGDQFFAPGHMVGWFETDDPDDPTIRIINSIDNETSYAWTSYTVTIVLSRTFTISGAAVMSPGDWTVEVAQPVYLDALQLPHSWTQSGGYAGTVTMLAGTPVGIGDAFDFKYTISFSGSTSYAFCQEMTPAPEPATVVLLAMGGIAVVARRRRSAGGR